MLRGFRLQLVIDYYLDINIETTLLDSGPFSNAFKNEEKKVRKNSSIHFEDFVSNILPQK